MLAEEFARADIDFPEEGTRFIDVLKIERNVNSHKLEETYKRYTSETLECDHEALADVRATAAVFHRQFDHHATLPSSVQDLEELCMGENHRVDHAGKMYEKDGQVYWSFGKHRDKPVNETKDYALWVLGSDFPLETKKQIRRILELEAAG